MSVCLLFVQPFNPMAENYAREVYAGSTFMDPRGGQRLQADAEEGVQMLRQVEGDRAVLLRSRGADKGVLLRAAAVRFFNTSTVTPAAENRVCCLAVQCGASVWLMCYVMHCVFLCANNIRICSKRS